jgi:sugar/nucleoside kinase (ribokinase family)
MADIRRLLHLGNVVVDLVLNVPHWPQHGADVLADAALVTPGGGFNVMAAAARQGLPVAYAGAHGTGPFADLARAGLAREGIEVLQPPKDDLDTGVVVVLVDAAGERTFVTSPGAEAQLTADDLAAVRAGPGDAVYLSGYGLAHASNRPALLDWLARLDDPAALPGPARPVFFDPGPLADTIPPGALAAVLRRADWLTCNIREAALLTGADEPAAAARLLAGRQAGRGVIVRTGPAGCLLAFAGRGPITVAGFPVTALDSNGAGDTHAGTFIAALAAGAAPPEAARIANAAAAVSVTRPGPATAPQAAELARFLARQPRPDHV